jgi:hypothetical protein
MEILKKTLSEMNFSFSSNEFSKRAKKNGLSKMEIANGAIAMFLHRNAVQGETRRMWRKHNGILLETPKTDQIMEAIALLKSQGYKVLKPVSDWVEL